VENTTKRLFNMLQMKYSFFSFFDSTLKHYQNCYHGFFATGALIAF